MCLLVCQIVWRVPVRVHMLFVCCFFELAEREPAGVNSTAERV